MARRERALLHRHRARRGLPLGVAAEPGTAGGQGAGEGLIRNGYKTDMILIRKVGEGVV